MEINISNLINNNIINSSDFEELLYVFDKYLLEYNIYINKTSYYKLYTCMNCNNSNKILMTILLCDITFLFCYRL